MVFRDWHLFLISVLVMSGRVSKFRIGDLIRYKYPARIKKDRVNNSGVVISLNDEGGTLRVATLAGSTHWFITSYCEVIKNV